MFTKLLRPLATILFFLQLLTACGSSPVQKSDSAQGLFQYGSELSKNEDYFEALQVFAEVKNKHPYSQYAVSSELEIADIHFKQDSYIEAQGSYQAFKSLHPKHPKSAYVTFQLAMSFLKQLPDSIDRDLSLADKAILYFDEVINSYSRSEFVKQAMENKTIALTKQADKELYIARFYFKRKNYLSALGRFEKLLTDFPLNSYQGEVLYSAAYSAHKEKNDQKTKDYYVKLVSRFPGSIFAKKAKKELSQYAKN